MTLEIILFAFFVKTANNQTTPFSALMNTSEFYFWSDYDSSFYNLHYTFQTLTKSLSTPVTKIILDYNILITDAWVYAQCWVLWKFVTSSLVKQNCNREILPDLCNNDLQNRRLEGKSSATLTMFFYLRLFFKENIVDTF